MRRTGRRHRDGFFLRSHILAIYFQIPETTIASREKLGAGLLEAFYPTIENVNNGLVHRNSLCYSAETALPPVGTSVKRCARDFSSAASLKGVGIPRPRNHS